MSKPIEFGEVVEAVDSSGMAIGPEKLEGVPADDFISPQLESSGAEFDVRTHDATERVGFALAGGTWASAPEHREWQIHFATAGKDERQFFADDGGIF